MVCFPFKLFKGCLPQMFWSILEYFAPFIANQNFCLLLTIKESLLQNSPDESLARKAYLLLKNDTEAISISVFTNNYEILELNF